MLAGMRVLMEPLLCLFLGLQGDPSAVPYAVENTKKILGKKPIFGICMGHQVGVGSREQRIVELVRWGPCMVG